MHYVSQEYSNLYEIKKSKFFAHLIPYDQFQSCLDKLKAEHQKARHFVYAYRYLNQYDQIVENCSDDGEPKGTSGKPSLAVLSGANIINTAVIIVRYFGGIKLGTGGLVRAYGHSVKDVIDNSTLLEYVKLIEKKLTLQYSQLSQVEYLLDKYNVNILNKEFLNDVQITIKSSKENIQLLNDELQRDIKLKDI
jgi:uncharacterized YigZ family protein